MVAGVRSYFFSILTLIQHFPYLSNLDRLDANLDALKAELEEKPEDIKKEEKENQETKKILRRKMEKPCHSG